MSKTINNLKGASNGKLERAIWKNKKIKENLIQDEYK